MHMHMCMYVLYTKVQAVVAKALWKNLGYITEQDKKLSFWYSGDEKIGEKSIPPPSLQV